VGRRRPQDDRPPEQAEQVGHAVRGRVDHRPHGVAGQRVSEGREGERRRLEHGPVQHRHVVRERRDPFGGPPHNRSHGKRRAQRRVGPAHERREREARPAAAGRREHARPAPHQRAAPNQAAQVFVGGRLADARLPGNIGGEQRPIPGSFGYRLSDAACHVHGHVKSIGLLQVLGDVCVVLYEKLDKRFR
jgi:hypothetical protein